MELYDCVEARFLTNDGSLQAKGHFRKLNISAEDQKETLEKLQVALMDEKLLVSSLRTRLTGRSKSLRLVILHEAFTSTPISSRKEI